MRELLLSIACLGSMAGFYLVIKRSALSEYVWIAAITFLWISILLPK